MNRKEFFKKALKAGMCCAGGMIALGSGQEQLNGEMSADVKKQIDKIKGNKNFVENWLVDLLNAMDEQLDEPAKLKLISACGHGCFKRHKFKSDLAVEGKGDVEKLIKAVSKRFGLKREGNKIHIGFGAGPEGCWCPVLRDNKSNLHTFHCNCTRATHQAIWETALGRPIKVDIVETIRRGGKNCRFIVHLPEDLMS
ncbi:MAG: hypothetical protein GY765_29270 [bacterium]|nr:hypothetical protein [bacterium]